MVVGWRSHHTSLTQAKKDLKKETKMSPNDAWQGYLKTWYQWNSQNFSGIATGLHKRDLQRHIWTPGCKDQRPDAHPSWKTEVSKSAWIKPCTGNAVEWACIIAEIPPKQKTTTTSQRQSSHHKADAHLGTDTQVKFLYYPLQVMLPYWKIS